jgi:hypothetical protein
MSKIRLLLSKISKKSFFNSKWWCNNNSYNINSKWWCNSSNSSKTWQDSILTSNIITSNIYQVELALRLSKITISIFKLISLLFQAFYLINKFLVNSNPQINSSHGEENKISLVLDQVNNCPYLNNNNKQLFLSVPLNLTPGDLLNNRWIHFHKHNWWEA